MSGKSPRKSKNFDTPSKTDPRVRHTRDALGDALVILMHEKPFDSITVQDVLDRAKVGRSTFYAHFKDKEDLFLSDVEDFFVYIAGVLTVKGDTSDRVAPVKELFAHVADSHKFRAALAAAGKLHDTFDLGIGIFARGIDERLAAAPRSRSIAAQQRAAMAHALSGALFSLLGWWLDHGTRESAEQMDATFHRIVWAGVSASSTSVPLKHSRS